MLINNLLRDSKNTPSVSTTTYFLVDFDTFANIITSIDSTITASTLSKYVKSVTLPERKVDTSSIEGQMVSVQHAQLKQTFDTFQVTFFDDRDFTIRKSLLKYMLTKVFDFSKLAYKSASTYKGDITVYVIDNFLGSTTTNVNNISTIENIVSNKSTRDQTTLTPVYAYTFYGQFITEIPELTFSATDELEPTITVTFTYDWYKVDVTTNANVQITQLSLIQD